MKKIVSRKL